MNLHATRPRIAVLMAAYNGMAWLSAQVDSILAQEGVEVRLVVSVDPSTDGTEQWFIDRSEFDDRVVVLPHHSQRCNAAENFFRLMREAPTEGCDYIALADQDDIWQPDKLAHAAASLRASGADGYSSNVRAFWPDGRSRLIVKSQPQRKWDYLFEAAGPGCTYVFSDKLFADIRQFAIVHCYELQVVDLHDWFCYAFARSRGYTWFIDAESKMLYRQHADNHLGVNSGLKALLERCRRISQGWWLAQTRAIALLLGLDKDPFVQRWIQPNRRAAYLHLAVHALQCRRRVAEGVFMAGAMLLLWVIGPRANPSTQK